MQQLSSSSRCASLVALSVVFFSVVGTSSAQEAAGRGVVPQAEFNDVATLPPPGPHRLVIGGTFQAGAVRVVDGDKMRLVGSFFAAPGSNLVVGPNDRYYLAETSVARGNRGPAQNYVSIYDDQLKLVGEVDIPGRLKSVPKTQTFDVSADGRLGYVFNMQPAASVNVVDLQSRKVTVTVEVPGCGLVYPFGNTGFASLCGDGSAAIATPAAKGKYAVTRTKRFFDAEKDPVFEESLVDRQTGKALLITFTGRVLPVTLGANPVFEEPWSLQEAAGHPLPSVAPEMLAWRPGGSHLAAWHKASGRLFVLMHPGTHWTHQQDGTEVWVFDIGAHKRVARFALSKPGSSIAVTQDAEPLLFVVASASGGPGGGLTALNAQTGEEKGALPGVTGGILGVHGF
jgi:methylamine dehydrogenase heavy chain